MLSDSYVVTESPKAKRDSSSSSSGSSRSQRRGGSSSRRSGSKKGRSRSPATVDRNKVLFITSFGQPDATGQADQDENPDEAKQREYLSCLGRAKPLALDQSYQSNLKRLKENMRTSSSRSPTRSRSKSPNSLAFFKSSKNGNHSNISKTE